MAASDSTSKVVAVSKMLRWTRNALSIQNTISGLSEKKDTSHCVKSVVTGNFSGLHFPVFGVNTAKCGPEKTPYLDNFHAVQR